MTNSVLPDGLSFSPPLCFPSEPRLTLPSSPASPLIALQGNTFKVTGFVPVPPSSMYLSKGLTLSFDVPSALTIETFLAAPIFAIISGTGDSCPKNYIRMQ